MRLIGKILLGILASVGFSVILLMAAGLYLVTQIDGTTPVRVPEKFVLTLDLDKSLAEGGNSRFTFGKVVTHQDALIAIRRAKDDPRVVGISATISQQAHGLAQTQELRDVLAEFRASGKPSWIYAETIGEGTPATSAYYLASVFEQIWMQQSGNVGLAGIAIEQPFFKGLLDRFGVKAQVIQRKEYKSAMENLTNSEISPANKEALTSMLGSFFDQFVTGISEQRSISKDDVRRLIDKGPLLASEALEAKLIDKIAYRDEFDSAAEIKFGTDETATLGEYMSYGLPAGTPAAKKRFAIVNAIGQVVRGKNEDPFGRNDMIASETTAEAIRDAANNSEIDAIIIRIDSPGGSYVASDTIWREVVLAKAKKPVIASMGNTAASGGYFIAMAADRVFAQPATITGSIGVIMGKLAFGGAFEKLDINWDRIAFGESAGTFSAIREFTPEELARLNEMIDAAYADFTTKAAAGRGKEVSDLERHARGRVWTGADALAAGLVDEMGGLTRAIDYAKERVGAPLNEPVWLIPFPAAEDPWKALFDALEEGNLPFGLLSAIKSWMQLVETLAPIAAEVESRAAPGVRLYADPIVVN